MFSLPFSFPRGVGVSALNDSSDCIAWEHGMAGRDGADVVLASCTSDTPAGVK